MMMRTLAATLPFFVLSSPALAGDIETKVSVEGPLVDAAVRTCTRNEGMIRELFGIEVAEGMPAAALGLTAAAAIEESSCKPAPKCGDGGKACGLLQFWQWANKHIRRIQGELAVAGRPIPPGDPREDWRAAARFWVRHFMAKYVLVKRHCKGLRGYNTMEEQWVASANVTAVRNRRCLQRTPAGKCVEWGPLYRCAHRRIWSAETDHIRRLRKLRGTEPELPRAVISAAN